jgi:hypothetical protein
MPSVYPMRKLLERSIHFGDDVSSSGRRAGTCLCGE